MRKLQLTWFCWSCGAAGLLVSVGLCIIFGEEAVNKPGTGIAGIVFGAGLFLLAQVTQAKTSSFRKHDKEG